MGLQDNNRKLIGESPFALKYGMEAIIPTEIGMPTIRKEVPEETSIEAIIKDLDMVNKLQETAAMRIASYQ